MKNIRIFFLRVLIGFWVTPVCILFSPLIWLIIGDFSDVKDFNRDMVETFWQGNLK